MSYPFLKIHSCNEIVNNVSFVDIDYSAASFNKIPTITTTADSNINIFITNITKTSARLNFSAIYTGNIKYTAIAFN